MPFIGDLSLWRAGQASAFFNEINPVGICEITAMRYEIADAMKCAAAHRGFILFHILPLWQNIS